MFVHTRVYNVWTLCILGIHDKIVFNACNFIETGPLVFMCFMSIHPSQKASEIIVVCFLVYDVSYAYVCNFYILLAHNRNRNLLIMLRCQIG